MRRIVLLLVVFAVAVGCSEQESASKPANGILTIPPPSSGPFVSVAVDNHFHDIHPSDHRELEANRPFVIRNEGSNLHNVSIVGTGISKDIKPGESFRVDPISKLGPPGKYKIFCKYHVSQGMRATITIVSPGSN